MRPEADEDDEPWEDDPLEPGEGFHGHDKWDVFLPDDESDVLDDWDDTDDQDHD